MTGVQTCALPIFATSLYNTATIERMIEHYLQILHIITVNAEILINRIDIKTLVEHETIISDFNATSSVMKSIVTVQQAFEERVRQTPDDVAIVFGDEKISFYDLNCKINTVANELRQMGVTADIIVGVMLDRSVELLIGILAILKAGGAYLPIDCDYPAERKRFMLRDSAAEVFLSQSWLCEDQSFFTGSVLFLDLIDYSNSNILNPTPVNSPSDLAYVLYTSGSTGIPKGVMVEHRSLINTLQSLEQRYPVGSNDAYILKTSCSFDVSTIELFIWFFSKGRLVILEPDGHKDPKKIMECVSSNNVTHIQFVPSMMDVFMKVMDPSSLSRMCSLKHILLAGEVLGIDLVRRLSSCFPNALITNCYC